MENGYWKKATSNCKKQKYAQQTTDYTVWQISNYYCFDKLVLSKLDISLIYH